MKKSIGITIVSVLAIALIGYGVLNAGKSKRESVPQTQAGSTGELMTDVYESYSENSYIYDYSETDENGISESESDTEISVSTTAASVIGKLFGKTEKETAATQAASESKTRTQSGNSNTATTAASTTASSTTTVTGTYEYSYAGFNPTYIEITDSNWEMVLVNRHYILRKDYVPQLAYAITGDTSSKKLDYRVAPHYNEMYQAAAKDGIYLTTVSGYRSYDLQKTNFENKITKYVNQGMSRTKATQEAAKIILPPGTSEHNAGLAMDIISLEQNFENTKAFRWLSENAQNYGFILRYPKDKQDITEIIYEPWHWRYVGVENAKKIKASGLCLEEYLGKVPQN